MKQMKLAVLITVTVMGDERERTAGQIQAAVLEQLDAVMLDVPNGKDLVSGYEIDANMVLPLTPALEQVFLTATGAVAQSPVAEASRG